MKVTESSIKLYGTHFLRKSSMTQKIAAKTVIFFLRLGLRIGIQGYNLTF